MFDLEDKQSLLPTPRDSGTPVLRSRPAKELVGDLFGTGIRGEAGDELADLPDGGGIRGDGGGVEADARRRSG